MGVQCVDASLQQFLGSLDPQGNDLAHVGYKTINAPKVYMHAAV